MFDYTGCLIAGVIDGYKTGERSFSRTTELTDNYLEKGKITQAQAIEIAIACPEPSVEPETQTDDVVTEETTETEVTEDGTVIKKTESGGEDVE